MTTSTRPPAAGALTVTAWRDHDRVVCRIPGMALGALPVPAGPALPAARSLFDAGARRVALAEPVDLTDEADAARTVRALSLVGALSSLAVAVEWRVRTPGEPEAWIPLSHLHPPAALSGAPEAGEALRTWHETYYLCKCVYRKGPGFLQVRDRRRRQLRRFTIDDPAYRQAVATLVDGAPAAAVPDAVLADLAEEELVVRVGEYAWWAPYQVQRWPLAALVI
ncbi:DUF5825 family protein [Streptomyces cinnamoneus]|uniref:DUF5825 family protein n=1 Tax=Streptomyces cinnamoneus TaxID=53446 RepID=UPI0037B92F7E